MAIMGEEQEAKNKENEGVKTEKSTEKEPRARKKKIISDLRKQMEFYFSSANITKDRFMGSICENGKFVEIDLFLTKFNKIKNISMDKKMLLKAIKSSDILEVSEDELGVRRSVPVVIKENDADCTIYVENIPSHADHTWVRNIFEKYGHIDYVSLPRFKSSNRPKGFGFVEFDSPETAEKALKAFGCTTLNPEELMSITTFNQEQNPSVEMPDDIDTDGGAKRKREDEESDEKEIKKNKTEEESQEQEDEDIADPPKKKKRKRKKNKKLENQQEIESINLRIMSKVEWKKLRNKYLNIQRKNFIDLKKKMKDSYNHQQKYEKPMEKQVIEIKPELVKKNLKPEFIPDVIVKIDFENYPQDPKKLRETIKEVGGSAVAYVDTRPDEKDVLVRFHSSEGAKTYLKKGLWKNMSMLEGEGEQAYWDHIIGSWEKTRRNKKSAHPTDSNNPYTSEMRGKDKVIQKAFKKSQEPRSNTRIVFDD